MRHGCCQGFPKHIKSCSHFSKILLITADIKTLILKQVVKEAMGKIAYSVQGLVAKVKDTIADG